MIKTSKRPKKRVRTLPKVSGASKTPRMVGTKARRKNQIIVSIVGIYIIAAGILGMFVFGSRNPGVAEADEPAQVASSIRFINDGDLKTGETVKLAVTLQNTSILESVNNLSLDLFATRNAIDWESAVNSNKFNSDPIAVENNSTFRIPVLSAGERLEYEVEGKLLDGTLDYLVVLGRIKYSNSAGSTEIKTNRLSATLNPKIKDNNLLALRSIKDKYVTGEPVSLTLSKNSEEFEALTADQKGKVYISPRNSQEVAATLDCLPEELGICEVSTNLENGAYSALFIADNESKMSEIAWFEVGSVSTNSGFQPSSQVELELPFGSRSVNDAVAVIARKVVDKDDLNTLSQECIFEVLQDGKVIDTVESGIKSDRSCRALVYTQQLPGPGIYTIKLQNSEQSKDVSFSESGVAKLTLNNLTTNLSKGSDVRLSINDILDENGDPVNDVTGSVTIYHTESGRVNTLNDIFGQPMSVVDGELEVQIPGTYFSDGGYYLTFVELSNGLLTEFLGVNFQDSKMAFSQSGVLVDDLTKLQAGQDLSVRLNGVIDRSGNLVNSGVCRAHIYSASGNGNPALADGSIQAGECKVQIDGSKLTKAGPTLISFVSEDSNVSINQTTQVYLYPSQPDEYGQLQLEFEPALKDFANTAVIGPVVDSQGNLASGYDYILRVYNMEIDSETGEEQEVLARELENVEIVDGYGSILLPSSTLSQDKMKLAFLSADEEVVLERTFELFNNSAKLTLPSIPSVVTADEDIEIAARGLGSEETTECIFRLYKSSTEFVEEVVEYDLEADSCDHTFAGNKFRDVEKLLVQVEIGDKRFNRIVETKSGAATNIFKVRPQLRFNAKNEIEVKLLTSPIVDRNGRPVIEGEVRWQYNGKISSTPIKNGFSELLIKSQELDSKDIETSFNQRFLDLDLEVQASLVSFSDTNNINVYLDNYDIASDVSDFNIRMGTNYVQAGLSKIFNFSLESCQSISLSSKNTVNNLKTHYQSGNCYVQVFGEVGRNTLLFSEDGFNLGSFEYVVDKPVQEVDWCVDSQKAGCNFIQVLAPTSSSVTVTLFDNEKEYRFESDELENSILFTQNGLNPIKPYLVEVEYKDLGGREIRHYREILGEDLLG